MKSKDVLETKRHYKTPSEKELNVVVEAVADLIVAFLKGNAKPEPADKTEVRGT